MLYSFCSQTNCVDGEEPYTGLVLAPNGIFYGTTTYGGASATCDLCCGTVFQITRAGALTTLTSFAGLPVAYYPSGNLVRGTKGNLYGATSVGGIHCGGAGCGTVFNVTSGEVQTVYSLCAKTLLMSTYQKHRAV